MEATICRHIRTDGHRCNAPSPDLSAFLLHSLPLASPPQASGHQRRRTVRRPVTREITRTQSGISSRIRAGSVAEIHHSQGSLIAEANSETDTEMEYEENS